MFREGGIVAPARNAARIGNMPFPLGLAFNETQAGLEKGSLQLATSMASGIGKAPAWEGMASHRPAGRACSPPTQRYFNKDKVRRAVWGTSYMVTCS